MESKKSAFSYAIRGVLFVTIVVSVSTFVLFAFIQYYSYKENVEAFNKEKELAEIKFIKSSTEDTIKRVSNTLKIEYNNKLEEYQKDLTMKSFNILNLFSYSSKPEYENIVKKQLALIADNSNVDSVAVKIKSSRFISNQDNRDINLNLLKKNIVEKNSGYYQSTIDGENKVIFYNYSDEQDIAILFIKPLKEINTVLKNAMIQRLKGVKLGSLYSFIIIDVGSEKIVSYPSDRFIGYSISLLKNDEHSHDVERKYRECIRNGYSESYAVHNSDKIYTYLRYFKELNIVLMVDDKIASKVLDNNVYKLNLQNNLVKQMLIFMLFVTVSSAFVYRLGNSYISSIRGELNVFRDFFNSSSKKYSPIDTEKLTYVEFDELAYNANNMIKSRIILEKENSMLSLAVNSAEKIGFISVDFECRVTSFSKGAEKLFKLNKDTVLDTFISDLIGEINCNVIADAVVKGNLFSEYNSRESELKRTDGTFFTANIIFYPLLENNVSVGNLLIIEDITELKKIEEELIRKEKYEAISLLAGGIAHDFNNILAAVRSFLSLIEIKGTGLSTEILSYLKDSNKSLDRAVYLSNQLLSMSKGGEPVKSINNINEIIKDTVSFIMSGSSLKISLDLTPELWSADVDSDQISQVLQNLLINAKQAVGEQSGSINIKTKNIYRNSKIDRDIDDRWVEISISDNGSGIDESMFDRIFEPFYTTKKSGSGLGLAIVKKIIERHGGNIFVESRLGVGTKFIINLPAASVQSIVEKENHGLVKHGSGIVLIMDDNQALLESTGELITLLGYDVILVTNGEEALQNMSDNISKCMPIDVFILDFTIQGGMGGKETAQEIIRIDRDAKIILTSGYAEDDLIQNYLDYGFSGFLKKPYSLEDISTLLVALSKK